VPAQGLKFLLYRNTGIQEARRKGESGTKSVNSQPRSVLLRNAQCLATTTHFVLGVTYHIYNSNVCFIVTTLTVSNNEVFTHGDRTTSGLSVI
jgi:hypothetical protein